MGTGRGFASRILKEKGSERSLFYSYVAEWTGLEPATPGVTGRYSNRLNYHSALKTCLDRDLAETACESQDFKLASPRGFEPRLSP